MKIASHSFDSSKLKSLNNIEDATTKTIMDQLELIAAEVEATPGQVALAWTLSKDAFPVIGARTLTHLEDSLKALEISLNTDQLERLDNISKVAMGYPLDLLKTVQKSY